VIAIATIDRMCLLSQTTPSRGKLENKKTPISSNFIKILMIAVVDYHQFHCIDPHPEMDLSYGQCALS
jgi:hypothetical protein